MRIVSLDEFSDLATVFRFATLVAIDVAAASKHLSVRDGVFCRIWF